MLVQKKVDKTLNIIFNAQVSIKSMGGGDKIVLSLTRELQKNGFAVNFFGSPEGIGMAKGFLANCNFYIINFFHTENYGFVKTYLLRIVSSLSILKYKLKPKSIVWSASDFLPDVLPAFWQKLFHRDLYWIGNLFLRARNPFAGEVEKNFSTILYFISQKISLFLYKLLANRVCVLCKEDFDNFARYLENPARVCLISGGIDTATLNNIKRNSSEKYDACFIGRFHYQKGIPTLIKIWADVNRKLGPKQLAIIGWGNEMEVLQLMELINKSGYPQNFHVLGFKDGEEKLKVLKSSSILLFPSNFESWGVVIAEALGCGVPVVAFELDEIKDNFPHGVVWSKNYQEYLTNTLNLLQQPDQRMKLSAEAYEFSESLDWKYSAQKFTAEINF